MALRTLNVSRDIPGVASNVLVNVAYEPAPGVSLAQTREVEYKLQMEIQRILLELAGRPASKCAQPGAPQYITLDEARSISGHTTGKAFDNWSSRHNRRHPEVRVLRRTGYVEINSLHAALQVAADTPHHVVRPIRPIGPKGPIGPIYPNQKGGEQL